MKIKNINIYRNIFTLLICFTLLLLLIIGIGVVDNSIKSAQNNPFLNGFYIDSNNYILCLRYLGIIIKIPYGIKGIINSVVDFIKSLFICFLIVYVKIKAFIVGLF